MTLGTVPGLTRSRREALHDGKYGGDLNCLLAAGGGGGAAGIRIPAQPLFREYFATCATDPTKLYRITHWSCTYLGFAHWQACTQPRYGLSDHLKGMP